MRGWCEVSTVSTSNLIFSADDAGDDLSGNTGDHISVIHRQTGDGGPWSDDIEHSLMIGMWHGSAENDGHIVRLTVDQAYALADAILTALA